ncbi:helicase-exonuclease AddAB subunit AddB [Shouchella miscanthi]|uniref:helicase-exonuclease AddAB subunit AddB n=1 Tax=Shouchella miscanthi TaxID=2598861 RepID=UPI001643F340|nr:helicase-exonuclease AddAB subunit AddB [Shouchella miscanthi]
MIHFYLGRSGSGKSTKLKKEAIDQLNRFPIEGPEQLFLVPDQMSFQVEYELAKKSGGFSKLSVLSLQSLAERILVETDQQELPLLDRTGMHVLLRKIVEEQKEKLRIFKRSSHATGFVQEMEQVIIELRQQELTADAFYKASRNQSPLIQDKMHDIYIVYKGFEQAFQQRFTDKENQLKHATDVLATSNVVKDAVIYVDGFYDFNKLERRFLTTLFKEASSVQIALTLDKDATLDTFFYTNETYQRLVETLQQQGLSYKTSWFEPSLRFKRKGIASLEEALVYQDHEKRENDGSVQLVEAVNRRVEIDALARSIRSYVRTEGYRYSDIAVVTRDLTLYSDLIERIFPMYDLPFFVDQTKPMIHHPLIEFIRSSLEAIMQRYPYEALFRAFKTDLFIPLDEDSIRFREQIDQLETIVLAQGIKGKLWSTDVEWRVKTARHGYEDEPTEEEMETNHAVNELKNQLIAPLNQLEKQIKQSKTIFEMSRALYTFFEALSIPDKINQVKEQAEAEGAIQLGSEYQQVWDGVIRILDQLVEIGGDNATTPQAFLKTLNAGFENMSFRMVPPAIDQVTVGDMERSRLPKVRVTFVIGVNEGVIPSTPRDKGIVSAQERHELKEKGVSFGYSSFDRIWHEHFYAYIAQTNAEEKLVVSYALADEEGAALLPSPLIRYIKDTLDSVPFTFVQNEADAVNENHSIEYVSHPKQAFMELIRQLQKWKQGETIDSIWWDVYHWFIQQEHWQSRLKMGLQSLDYAYKEVPLPIEKARDLYGSELVMSVSRMELFKQCSFRHFSQYGLKLKERDVYKLEAFDIGELFHMVLKLMSTKQKDRNKTWKKLSYDECREMTIAAVEEVAPIIQRKILLSTSHYQYITDKLKEIALNVTEALRQQALLSKFETIGLEVAFGPQTNLSLPSYSLEHGMNMTVRGRIDRIDQAKVDGQSYLSIIDYKSSATALAFSDVIEGLSLQIPVYLTVALKGSKAWLDEPSQIGGMFYFHIHNPVLEDAEHAEEERLKAFKLSGWMPKDRQLATLFDQSLEEAAKSKIVPVEFKKDGTFHSRSKVVTEDDFRTLFAYTEQKIVEIGNDIVSGKTEVKPFQRENGHVACSFCPMQAVCQFDPTLPGYDYNEIYKKTHRDALEEMRDILDEGEGEDA